MEAIWTMNMNLPVLSLVPPHTKDNHMITNDLAPWGVFPVCSFNWQFNSFYRRRTLQEKPSCKSSGLMRRYGLWQWLISPDRSNVACWGQLECYRSLFGFKSTWSATLSARSGKKKKFSPSVLCSIPPHCKYIEWGVIFNNWRPAHTCVKQVFGECGLSLIVLGVNINIPQYYYEPKQHISGSVLRNYIGVGNSPVSYSSWCWVRWKSPEALGMESARSTAWISLVYMLAVPVSS